MGGQGSGRPPSVETILKRSKPEDTPIGTSIYLPNYSGLQDVKKTDAAIIKADGTLQTNLNADMVDGSHASAFASGTHTHLLSGGATDVTSSAAELNVLDGVPATLTATELGYVDGVTSAIQTQIDGKESALTKGDLTATSPISLSATRQVIGGTAAISISDASTTVKGAASFNSTNFSASAGAINTIQDIATTSTPQFARMGLGTAAGATIPLTISTGDNSGLTITKTASGNPGLIVNNGYIYVQGGAFGFGTGDNNDFTLRANATEYQRVKTTGVIQMNSYGAGTATFDASGNISSVSDERFKNILGNFSRGLAEIKLIQPIIYKWKPESNLETEHEYIGFSAQKIKDIVPEAISEDMKKRLTFSDRAIIAVLVNAVKELNNEIEKLKAR